MARGPSVAVARGCAVREGGDSGRGGCTRPHQSKFARPARWVSPRRQEWMRWQQGQVQGRRGEVGRLADCLPRWHAVARLRRYCEARWHCFGRGDGGPPAVVECARPRGPGAGRRPWWCAHGRAIPVRQLSCPMSGVLAPVCDSGGLGALRRPGPGCLACGRGFLARGAWAMGCLCLSGDGAGLLARDA